MHVLYRLSDVNVSCVPYRKRTSGEGPDVKGDDTRSSSAFWYLLWLNNVNHIDTPKGGDRRTYPMRRAGSLSGRKLGGGGQRDVTNDPNEYPCVRKTWEDIRYCCHIANAHLPGYTHEKYDGVDITDCLATPFYELLQIFCFRKPCKRGRARGSTYSTTVVFNGMIAIIQEYRWHPLQNPVDYPVLACL